VTVGALQLRTDFDHFTATDRADRSRWPFNVVVFVVHVDLTTVGVQEATSPFLGLAEEGALLNASRNAGGRHYVRGQHIGPRAALPSRWRFGSDLGQDQWHDLTDVIQPPASVRITAFITHIFQDHLDLPPKMNAVLRFQGDFTQLVYVCQSPQSALKLVALYRLHKVIVLNRLARS